ncbi:Glucose/arabinose dehydrogenase, beta-propeller fold [Alkalispirochaeta americana]|uniref:Glucose/arabinose dehydrogenase, beta-propeller fold n=1 Tax=Alkalispirochaeta americana TaxID=159291 RepID=A0A1N6WWH8_9SPIO|nr:PQQ-dependent sugar dehydrogenase [Alkalispirochaeta americana]SIQ94381.1 Glucose/arabinose dehydrogenase, beta-propeller fold [Alkalispirochaeta americana]
MRVFVFFSAAIIVLFGQVDLPGQTPRREMRGASQEHGFYLERVVTGLEHPWAIAFLPDGTAIVTERAGRAHLLDETGLRQLSGLPPVQAGGQGGLLDVKPHPNFHENSLLYFSYVTTGPGGSGTAIGRGRLEGLSIREWEEIFRMNRFSRGTRHFGSRLSFLPDGTLLATLGDRGESNRAQDRKDHAGSTIRIRDDGSIPDDNPWPNTPGVQPELFTWGNRNSQGMTVDRETGRIWQTEHGPRGGDELNLIQPGRNYGWPVISHGVDYRTGQPPQEGTHHPGMEQPVLHWTPALAPSGLVLYTGEAFPGWQGNLFAGGLAGQQIRRIVLEGETVIHEEVLLDTHVGRIRDVAQAPQGFLYLVTDQRGGAIYRLTPAHGSSGQESFSEE